MTDMMKLRVAIFLLIASVFLVNSVPAPAQDTKAQESRKARLEKEIALLNSQLKENSSKMMPMPVRIWPMPAIPEIEAFAAADRASPRTWATPRTTSMMAVSGTPML